MSIDNALQELAAVEPTRDRWGRPLVPPRSGKGKPQAYTRPTTIADTLDDRHNLELWMQRQVLLGTLARPDLHALAATSDPTDKAALNRICSDLRDAAASDAKANMGTAVHAAVEAHNRGGEPPAMFAEHVDAYVALLATIGAEVDGEHVEQFVVNDTVGAAGTFDMRLRIGGRWFVADLKTGSTIEWSARAFAVQLAIYQGHTSTFDWGTQTHGDALELDADRGVIVHLPADDPTAGGVHWIDLGAGREALQRALWVREWRKRKDIVVPITTEIDGGGNDDHSMPSEESPVAVAVGTVDGPDTKPRRPRRPITPPIKPVPEELQAPRPTSGAADEGGECTQEQIDKLREELKALGPAKDHVTRWKDQAVVAVGGAPGPSWGITNSEGRTIRRFALALTACALADCCHDDDEAVVDDLARQVIALALNDEDMVQTHPVGRLIGVLTLDEARKVRKVAMASTVAITEDDRPVIRAA
jgi:hypothetical protein